jgi:hypothetical protein
MSERPEEELLEAGEAVRYLAEKWGIATYRVEAFKMLRRRLNIQPDQIIGNNTLWRKSTLDQIPKPQRGRKKDSGGNMQSTSSMILSTRKRRLLELVGV